MRMSPLWATPPISDSSDAGISGALNLLPGEAWDELREFANRLREFGDDEVGYEFVKYLYRRSLIVSFRWIHWNRFGPQPLKTAKKTVRLISSASAEDTLRLATWIARAEHFGGERSRSQRRRAYFWLLRNAIGVANSFRPVPCLWRPLRSRGCDRLPSSLVNRLNASIVERGEVAWYFIDDPMDFVLAIDSEGRLVVGRPSPKARI